MCIVGVVCFWNRPRPPTPTANRRRTDGVVEFNGQWFLTTVMIVVGKRRNDPISIYHLSHFPPDVRARAKLCYRVTTTVAADWWLYAKSASYSTLARSRGYAPVRRGGDTTVTNYYSRIRRERRKWNDRRFRFRTIRDLTRSTVLTENF